MPDINTQYEKLLKAGEDIGKELKENEKKFVDSIKGEINQKNQLTDAQVENIVDTMGRIRKENKSLQMISDLPSNGGNMDTKLDDETSGTVTVQINPETGERLIVGPGKITEALTDEITDTFEDLWAKAAASDKIVDVNINDQTIIDEATSQFDLKGVDIEQFLNLVKEYRAANGEISNLYSKLPSSIKKIVDIGADTKGMDNVTFVQIAAAKNSIAKTIMDSFISDVTMSTAVVDFNTEMDKLFKNANLDVSGMFYESIQNKIDMLSAVIEKVKENDDDEETKQRKIDQLSAVGTAINQAINMDEFMEKLPRIKIKKYDLERPDKIFNSFDNKYRESAYSIHSASLLPKVLIREFGNEYSPETIYRFVLAFCKYTMNMKTSNMADHTFMYYFVANIIFLSTEPDNEIEKKVRKNVKKCLSAIQK